MHTRGEESHNAFSHQKQQKSAGTESPPLPLRMLALGIHELRESELGRRADSMGQWGRGGAACMLAVLRQDRRPSPNRANGPWEFLKNPQSRSHPHCKPLV